MPDLIKDRAKKLAPRARLELATRWLIPPLAGLYQLNVFQITGNPSRLNLSLQFYSLTFRKTLTLPDDLPRPGKTFGRFGPAVIRIIVLPQTAFNIV